MIDVSLVVGRITWARRRRRGRCGGDDGEGEGSCDGIDVVDGDDGVQSRWERCEGIGGDD